MHTQSQHSAVPNTAASVGRIRLLKFLCVAFLPATLVLTSIVASATTHECEPFEKQVSFDGGLTWFNADDPNMPAQGFTDDSLYRFLLKNCEPNKNCLNTSIRDDTLEIFDVLVDVDGAGGYAPGFIPNCSDDPVNCEVTITKDHPGFENLDQPGRCIPENTATETTFVGSSSTPEIMSDPAYVDCPPDIDIEKATNGVDADDPNAGDAPQIEPGDAVFWTYKVTNTGTVTLFNVMVTDDQGVAVSCPTDILTPGGMMICTANGFADDLFNTGLTTVPGMCGNIPDWPLYENKGRATGESAQGEFVEDEDPSHYCNPPGPDIDIEKATNGVDADDANAGDAPQIAPGDPVTWTYKVTNTGNVILENVIVTDDQAVAVTCPTDTLAPGGMMTCTASGFAEDLDITGFTTVPGLCGGEPQQPLYENMGKATGQTVAGDFVEDIDPSHYCNPPVCGLTVVKGCELPPPPPPPAGQCDGKLQQYTVIWNGAGPINIAVGEGLTGSSQASVAPGDEVTFFTDGSTNDTIVNISGAVSGQSTFHVSCSDDDMDGDTSSNADQQQVSPFGRDCAKDQGDGKGKSGFINQWLLEGFVDKNGDVLDCTVPTGGPIVSSCEFHAMPASCDTVGKPSVITMRYMGGGCPGNNTQEGKSSCSGSIDGAQAVTVTLDGGTLGPIDPGQTFDVPTTGSNTVISLSNGGGTQTNNVHTSCSAPLVAGETFGGMELVALDGQGTGTDVIYSYLISNTGTETITGITALDDKLGPVPGSPLDFLVPGDSATLTAMAFISETMTNTVTVDGSVPSGAECLAMASATVTALGPPPCSVSIVLDKIEDKKIKWKLSNTSASQPATIESLTISWPGAESLKKIKFDGNDILKEDLRSPPSTTVVESEWLKQVKDRRLDIGDSGKNLEIEFTDDFPLKKNQPVSDFDLTVTFSEGCSVTF
ncbi:MAG: hypothetical protein OER22_06445 [Gammaproteobacteria bacterium]|nr:hypothetical protein [Gammaproteobacteria bacterium]